MKKVGAVLIAVLLVLSSVSLFSVFVGAQDCFLPCETTEGCNADQSCIGGCCVANNCQVPCTSTAECSLDHTCDTEQGCCVPIPCTTAGECPTPCPSPTAYSPAATFFLMQCNFCQYGFCVDPPPPPTPCSCTSGTLCSTCIAADTHKPICVALACVKCSSDGQCGDGDACTTDSCAGSGACSHAPVVCDDSNACTTDACSSGSGCVFTPNSAPCDDGLFCTSNLCSGGSCIVTGPTGCSDGVPCTDDSCTEAMGGKCVNTENDVNCDDSIACTEDKCSKMSGCSNTPKDMLCDDGLSCTDDTCDPPCTSTCKFGDSDGDGICDSAGG